MHHFQLPLVSPHTIKSSRRLQHLLQRNRRVVITLILAYTIFVLLSTLALENIPRPALPRPSRKPPRPKPPPPRLVMKRQARSYIWNNPKLCHDDDPPSQNKSKSIVIIVHSARGNIFNRRLIRQSWGSIKELGGWRILAVAFMLGHQDKAESSSAEFQEELTNENKKYGDLITRDFVDTYKNLTLKSIMGYEWLLDFCPSADIVIKTDDDIVINIGRLIEALDTKPIMGSSNYFCHVHTQARPNRNESHFHFIPMEEYDRIVWPPFCAGLAYVTTMKVVGKVVSVLDKFEELAWVDDAFLTGVVPTKYNSLRQMTMMTHWSSPEEQREMIGHVDQARGDWFHWPDASEGLSYKKYLLSWWLLPKFGDDEEDEGTRLLDEEFLKKIFFLMEHGEQFEKEFVGVWGKVRPI